MQTVSRIKDVIGSRAYLAVERFTILVRITDARVNYGDEEYLVEPVNGKGQSWVKASRVRVI